MTKICFVCLGNICRSPMAEFVMKDLVKDEAGIEVVSRATSSWEHGNPIHAGTQKILRQYGIPFDVNKTSQQVSLADLADFDVIFAMDQQNLADLRALSAGQFDDKIQLLVEDGVPDPWYTGDFEETYRLVKGACQKWLRKQGMKE
ncbi:low molecular weight protein-tyrosine-phosphatase [Streptococcus cuniculipharyngis]|uniref:protein-tyrosine-phosphatase n=1 Tax=Streptococcus cuniculipharyngis TaxID=1562651 RepID=A0A5C5S9I0_9STRE|nr:low molecular weight protein-tyrosine-phosphatase [Streptococcus cuniculipharyngis]TWS97166.1 low molecular weight phosphotyrosine protein phosphatase [Streptococcus cuniculipharyngis]